MSFRRRHRILAAGKSPSTEALKRTYNRAMTNGGVTQDFSANVENIREISRKLGYDILSDASFVYVPSSYGESRNYSQNPRVLKNLIKSSEEINNSSWNKGGVFITPDAIANPIDGNITADLIIEDTLNTNKFTSSSLHTFIVPNKTYVFSIYLKYAGKQFIRLNNSDSISGKIRTFDLINGTVDNSVDSFIEVLSDGWYRCGVIRTMGSSVGNGSGQLQYGGIYLGTGANLVYAYGGQYEEAIVPTTYQHTTDGIIDLTSTRATTSRVTNKQGVIEDSCYNLLQRSEEFDNAIWVKTGSTISANVTTAPNGNLTADKLVEDAFNTTHLTRIAVAGIIVGNNYVYSIYAKAGERSRIRLRSPRTIDIATIIDLTNGSVLSSNFQSVTTKDVGDGWYLINAVMGIGTDGLGTLNAYIYLIDNSNNVTYLGDGTSGLYIWGAQLTQGSTLRPYLRTTNRLNVPKLDYSLSLAEPSLLIEPQRTNIKQQSEDFTQAVWVKQQIVITANTNLNLFGVNKSYYVSEDFTINTNHTLASTTGSITVGTTYTSSYYIKKADIDWIQIGYSSTGFGNNAWANFNLTTGNFGNIGSSATVTKKQLLNGYWLLTITCTATVTSTSGSGILSGTNNIDYNGYAVILNYTGTGVKLCDLAAIQVEAGSNATTYIPTTTAAVTRNGDTNFVDLWNGNMLNKDNFTLFVEGYLYDGQTSGLCVGVSNNTGGTAGATRLGFGSRLNAFYDIGAGGVIAGTNLITPSYYKFIVKVDGSTITWFRNGVQLHTLSSTTVDYRYLLINNGGSTYTVDKIALFNRTLSDADCVLLTTL